MKTEVIIPDVGNSNFPSHKVGFLQNEEIIILKNRFELKQYISMCQTLSWDYFSRSILEFNQLFHAFPSLLFSLQKLQIYDLVIRGKLKEAKE